ncbi:hypothetical protein BJ993_000588 [Nocardioides aromaticivorans]|uniref:Uncharacterized protein n=1 Tax=Nocardioides aromaticivorans TaxID=200618 RepID=A0A7Y9ZFV7_9ACTN|nr:hypothetical protein [Nocardioides aromaticivorans]NYI43508.1 hypothetical protein [Nocardioides aromaticivorans]
MALVAATGLFGASAEARAAAGCGGTAGTVVFVDFNELVGGSDDLRKGCAASASTAAEAFQQAGFRLAYSPAPGMQGYVCTVNEKPADRDCTGADAYWSLWWADGQGGPWKYSTLGVDSLDAPAGGYVAFSWHEGSGTQGTPPGVRPDPRTSTPTTSPTKDSGSTGGSTGGKGDKGDKAGDKGGDEDTPTDPSTSATPSGTPSAGASPTGKSSGTATASPTDASSSAVPGAEDITAGPETDDVAHTDDESGPFPTWALVGLGVGVLGAAGAVPLIRRRLG